MVRVMNSNRNGEWLRRLIPTHEALFTQPGDHFLPFNLRYNHQISRSSSQKKICLNDGTEPDVVAVGRAPLIVCLKKSLATDGDANEGGRRLTNADGCYELVTSPQGDRR